MILRKSEKVPQQLKQCKHQYEQYQKLIQNYIRKSIHKQYQANKIKN